MKTNIVKEYIVFPIKEDAFSAIMLLLAKLVNGILPVLSVLVSAQFIDVAISELASGTFSVRVLYWACGLVGVVVSGKLIDIAVSCFNAKFTVNINTAHEQRLVSKRSKIEFACFENADDYELISRVAEEQSDRITNGFNNLMRLADIFIRCLGVAITVAVSNVWCGLFLIAVFGVMFVVGRKCGDIVYDSWEKAMGHEKYARYLNKVLGGRDQAAERNQYEYTKPVSTIWQQRRKRSWLLMRMAFAKEFTVSKLVSAGVLIAASVIYAVLLIPVSNEEMSAGLYISVVSAVTQLLQIMTWNFSSEMEQFSENQHYAKDLSKYLALPEVSDAGQDLIFPKVRDIEFRDVSFSYPGTSEPILKHVNLVLKSGKSYGFVGENGAGKSTIVKLLTGLYRNYDGQILVNGVELRELNTESLSRLFAVTYQDFAKYQISVWDNLVLGSQNPSMDEVRELACGLGIEEKISQLPQQYNTDLGRLSDIGIDFSGGQWQKIAIMRSLLQHAPIQILDEPTAALDPIQERDSFQLFMKYRTGDISLLITHRLGGVKQVDEIVVLADGQICEQGTHQELCTQKGVYAKLYESQQKWYQ